MPPKPATTAFRTPRIPKSFLGVTIAADVAVALAEFCQHHGIAKSLYTEVALRRALAAEPPGAAPAGPSGPSAHKGDQP